MNSLSVLRLTTPSFLRIFLYNFKNSVLVMRCLVRLYLICGSGKVIQISSTSCAAKRWSMSSICVRTKATLCKPSSTAVFAPRQKTRTFDVDADKNSYRDNARPNRRNIRLCHSPIPKPKDFHFCKKSLFHLPLSAKFPETTSSRVGCKNAFGTFRFP